MNGKKVFSIITVICAIAAFALTRVIWPDPVGVEHPASNLIPLFVMINIFESLGVGVGIALLITSWRNVLAHPWVYGSVIWLLVSWWPHDSLHRIGETKGFGYLLGLEYGFHVTLMIAGFILVGHLINIFRDESAMPPTFL